jgi:hypothetical protein
MQATATLPQVLKEEKHTPHSVAFKVLDIAAPPMSSGAGISSTESTPEIKKRLEAYSQQTSPPLSEADIQQKLKRAEEKRRNFLMNRGGPVSPRVMEERRRNALEHKKSQDENSHLLRKKVEHDINSAEEKRRQTTEQRRNKLRMHIAKVEKIAKQQALQRQSSSEKLKSEIESKLEKASQHREGQLEKVKSIAHYSGEKKKSSADNMYLAHENQTLPAPSQMPMTSETSSA